MLDYKEIIIKHYGGGMSGSELAAQKLGSKSGINDFLRAFEACEKIGYPLPEGITNYGIAELVCGPSVASHNVGRNLSYEQPDFSTVHAEMTGRKNMTMIYQWNRYKRRCEDE